ncbi:two-component response regulator [Desulfocucumis palustris]|uniref:Two-component response regulator n=1 Tax=Desulfocucumis palustris TaxID=1898651 RepID=A0A2L2X9W1_9FIRM|nr:diguanylate cyclase [Desulfocucumis palustris]GBF32734.1 two-component response regulator [Desulfocucumis palustris]
MEPRHFKVRFKNKFADLFPVVPGEDREIIARTLTYANIYRLRIIAWLLIAFTLILIFIQLVYTKKVHLAQALEIAPYVMLIRIILLVVSAAFLIMSGKPESPHAITRRHYFCESWFVLANLIGYAILSGLIQSAGPGIASSYLMAILVSAAFLYINLAKSFFIYTVAWSVLSIMVWCFQYNWVVAFSAFLNGSFMTVIALVVSRIIYAGRVKDFLNQKTIELQKDKLAASNKMFKRLSYLDSLTNIPNRRYFDEFFSREWKRAVRQRELLSLIMVDIDQFKMFNDTYGHQAGDDILVQVATALSNIVKRPGDLVARYGGEEFSAILPDTDIAGARRIAGRMRQVVEELNISHPRTPTGHLTISLGVACVRPCSGELPENIIEAADKALYRAKKAGGNQSNWTDLNKP